MQPAFQHLLTAANLLAPNATAQAAFSRIPHALRRDDPSASDEAIAAAIIAALFDGMTYGNWPHDASFR